MNDFDFLHGSWDVANRRLTAPLGSGPATWVEFSGHAVVRPLFGGAGNIDEITFPTLGRQGVTLRLFDHETGRWSIHWSDSRTGRPDPPVVGGFTGDRGDFHGEDTYDGRPIGVHFTWYRLGRLFWILSAEPAASGAVDGKAEVRAVYWTYSGAPTTRPGAVPGVAGPARSGRDGLGPDTARWEHEFSADGGRTWELNWTMDLTRTGHVGA